MKVMTVQEVLEDIKPKHKKSSSKNKEHYNRFNKKNFNMLMVALANDVEFTSKVARLRRGEVNVKEIMPTKEFRKWCKKLLIKAGFDKQEADKITKKDFVIDDMEGLYDFFATAVYEYLNAGNRFDLIPKEDFVGSIALKNVPEKKKTAKQYSPQDRKYLGTYEVTKKAHKELTNKSGCPKFLKNRRLVSK